MTNQKIINLYEKGFSLRDIARLAGVSYQNIHQRLTTAKARRSGAITRDPRCVSPEESEIIKRLYVFGVPSIEVAEMVSLSDISVHRRLVKLNVRRRTPTEARFIKRLPIPDELMAKVNDLRKARELRRKNIELTNAVEKRREEERKRRATALT